MAENNNDPNIVIVQTLQLMQQQMQQQLEQSRQQHELMMETLRNLQIGNNPRQRAVPPAGGPVGGGANPRDPPTRVGLDSDSEGEEDFAFGPNNDRNNDQGQYNDRFPKIKADLPFFSGNLDVEDFLDWLAEVEKYFDLMRIADNLQVKYVAYKLRSGASAWWEQFQNNRRRQGKQPIRTWRRMREALCLRFLPADYDQVLYQKFQDCKQEDRTV